MKSLFFILTIFAAQAAWPVPQYLTHILPDEASYRYPKAKIYSSDYVSLAMQMGKRNLDWLKFMNANRPASQQIQLTKPGQLTSHPIEKPSVYSPKTIENDYNQLSATVPDMMKNIIFGNASFTKDPGLSLNDYTQWAKKIDDLYQVAERWNLLSPKIEIYRQNKVYDIRGFYYLSKEANLAAELSNWAQLSSNDQNRLSGYLANICLNTVRNAQVCQQELNTSIQQNTLVAFYSKYISEAQQLWDSFFTLEVTRPEFAWSSQNENLMSVPFRETTPVIQNYLKTNIEDEWHWNDWHLRLNFTSDAPVHVEFVPGALPHVNTVGGDTITMDDNAPLTEWDVQWTIRHEFGHVLGFPDCYVEFYDDDAQVMIAYQLDITNLMCSRAGKFKQIHFDELRKNYLN